MADRRAFLRRFLDTEAAGGIVLLVGAVAAIAWANSPWRAGHAALAHDAHHLVNDAAMSLFFLVVGLEIKRELVSGDLRDRRAAVLPVVAAVGGMVVPAAIYLAVTAGGPGTEGWGIPTATDIAFAVGVLALLGSRVPSALKLFLLSLAIVDDVGAIVVIAIAYSGELDLGALGAAGATVAIGLVLRRRGVESLVAYAVLAVGCWLATEASGVHATIAGVVFGFLAPDRHAERVERALHPWTSFVVVPVFALVNAGVELRSDAFDAPGAGAVAVGIAAGLVVGKLVGVLLASWLAVRAGVAVLPVGATWPTMAGVAAIAGIGFTVSLFVTDLAFEDAALTEAAKLAILVASVMAAVLGTATVRLATSRPARTIA